MKDYTIDMFHHYYGKRKKDQSMCTMWYKTREEAENAEYAYEWNEKTLDYEKMINGYLDHIFNQCKI